MGRVWVMYGSHGSTMGLMGHVRVNQGSYMVQPWVIYRAGFTLVEAHVQNDMVEAPL